MPSLPACFQELLHVPRCRQAVKLADAKDPLSEDTRVHSACGIRLPWTGLRLAGHHCE